MTRHDLTAAPAQAPGGESVRSAPRLRWLTCGRRALTANQQPAVFGYPDTLRGLGELTQTTTVPTAWPGTPTPRQQARP